MCGEKGFAGFGGEFCEWSIVSFVSSFKVVRSSREVGRRADACDCRHTQCQSMLSHYEICILLIEFEEDKFGMRVSVKLVGLGDMSDG